MGMGWGHAQGQAKNEGKAQPLHPPAAARPRLETREASLKTDAPAQDLTPKTSRGGPLRGWRRGGAVVRMREWVAGVVFDRSARSMLAIRPRALPVLSQGGLRDMIRPRGPHGRVRSLSVIAFGPAPEARLRDGDSHQYGRR